MRMKNFHLRSSSETENPLQKIEPPAIEISTELKPKRIRQAHITCDMYPTEKRSANPDFHGRILSSKWFKLYAITPAMQLRAMLTNRPEIPSDKSGKVPFSL